MLTTKSLFRFIISGLFFALATSLSFTGVAAEMPKVAIHTNHGDITIELDAEKAPKTVANFLKYVNDGYYTDTIFHRVMSNFMIQGGGFTPKFERKATRASILNEADNGLSNVRGSIAMARTSDPHSASAQFFINVVDNNPLDHTSKTPRGYGYAVFGKVIKGMKVVDTIRAIPTGASGPFPMNVPKSAVIISGMTHLNKTSKTDAAANTPKASPAPASEGN